MSNFVSAESYLHDLEERNQSQKNALMDWTKTIVSGTCPKCKGSKLYPQLKPNNSPTSNRSQ